MRTLIAGFGNALRGDDSFGVEVIRRLRERAARSDVDLMEVGTAGIWLAQELLSPCDRLIIVDAMTRGGAAGTVYVERVESVPTPNDVDMHLAVPARALGVAQALGTLPAEVFIVGCEPAEIDELTMELSAPVQAAVATALAHIDRLLATEPARTDSVAPHQRRDADPVAAFQRRDPDPVAALQRRDEILQIMFWLDGEGFGPDIAPADILRFIDDAAAVQETLRQLVEDGLAEGRPDATGALRYRLTGPGRSEARRRFMDEFEPYLARHAHGECGLADCDCHTGGAECRRA